ncbi:MAG TPA: FecR family protein [Stellaceae bacterium]|jgi:hypothetical protein|nr:FecR family protein [Stellaceae bacterium]
MKRRDLIFATALSSLVPATGFTAAAGAGSVVGIVGQCLVQRDGRPTPLKLGDAVAVSDTIDVPTDGKLKLRMSDGSVISLAPGTRMTVAAYQTDPAGQRQNAQLSLSQGLLRAVVAPVDHPTIFEVSTAVGTAAVRSTDWFIESKPGSAQVGVLSGSVVLRSGATRREVTIPARWGARLEAGRDPVEARVWAPQEFQAVISRTDVP